MPEAADAAKDPLVYHVSDTFYGGAMNRTIALIGLSLYLSAFVAAQDRQSPVAAQRHTANLMGQVAIDDADSRPSGELILRPTEVVILEGERTNALPRDGKNSVAHRGCNPTQGFFADPDNRIVRGAYKVDPDFRHLCRAQQGIVLEIALHRAPFLDGDLLAKHRRKPHYHLHLDLAFRGQ